MRIAANSITASLLATAAIALCLAPLANLSDIACAMLGYFKFSLVIAATFLARFRRGREATWWFGFATLGWGSILISGPGNSFGEVRISPEILLGDLATSVAIFLRDEMSPSWRTMPYPGGMQILVQLRAIVQVWFLILASLAGGWLALLIETRRNNQRASSDSSEYLDSSNPR